MNKDGYEKTIGNFQLKNIDLSIAGEKIDPDKKKKLKKSYSNKVDLSNLRAVFVSTGTNLNDDVFLPEETYLALNSIPHKPVNIEHNNSNIVGHIHSAEVSAKDVLASFVSNARDSFHGGETDSEHDHSHLWTLILDDGGKLIGGWTSWAHGHRHFITAGAASEGVTSPANDGHTHALSGLESSVQESIKVVAGEDFNINIPGEFDIITDSYLYAYQLPEIIAHIKEAAAGGEKFVSMEAFFNDYDYLVGNKIVKRNAETSFLDSSLRAKGGTGVFGEDRVGRVLRNIIFGGQGIVDNPANPASVIISAASKTPSVVESITYNDDFMKNAYDKIEGNCVLQDDGLELQRLLPMAIAKETEDMGVDKTDQLARLTEQLAAAENKIKELENAQSAQELDGLKSENDELQSKATELAASVASKDAEIVDLKANLTKVVEQAEALKSQNDELVEAAVKARQEKRASDFAKFDIGGEDLQEILAEIKTLDNEAYAKYLARADRLFKLKAEKHVEKEDPKKKEEEEAKMKKGKASDEDAEQAMASLASAEKNPVGSLFNGDSTDLTERVKNVIGPLFAKEKN